MITSLKHTLNPSFALVFAVGVERLYKVIDPVVLHEHPARSILTPSFYIPLTMVLLTLIFGSLSAIANEKFLDAKPSASATSCSAWFAYGSVFGILWMFYFSVDLNFVRYWWLGYAALCTTNGFWNWLVINSPHNVPHVAVNFGVATALVILLLAWPSVLSAPVWFYVLLVVIAALKSWQRRHERFANIKK